MCAQWRSFDALEELKCDAPFPETDVCPSITKNLVSMGDAWCEALVGPGFTAAQPDVISTTRICSTMRADQILRLLDPTAFAFRGATKRPSYAMRQLLERWLKYAITAGTEELGVAGLRQGVLLVSDEFKSVADTLSFLADHLHLNRKAFCAATPRHVSILPKVKDVGHDACRELGVKSLSVTAAWSQAKDGGFAQVLHGNLDYACVKTNGRSIEALCGCQDTAQSANSDGGFCSKMVSPPVGWE